MKNLAYIYIVLFFSVIVLESCEKEDFIDTFILKNTEVTFANETFNWLKIDDTYSYECSVDDEKSTITTKETNLQVDKIHETYPTMLAGKHIFHVRGRYGNFLSTGGSIEFDYKPDATLYVNPANDQNYSEDFTEFNSVTFNIKGYNVVSGKWVIAKSSAVTGDEGEYAIANGVEFTENELVDINKDGLTINSGILFDLKEEYKICVVVYSNTGVPVPASAVKTPSESGISYTRVDLAFTDIPSGDAHIAWIDASLAASIPVGVNVYFETVSESFTMMDNVTYTPFVNGSVTNGKAMVAWTEEIAAAAKNGFMIYTSHSCTALYYVKVSGTEPEYKEVDIKFSPMDYGANKIAWVDAADAALIPVGVKVYVETASTSYTLMDNLTYTPFASGGVTNGVAEIEWTEQLANAAKSGFMVYLDAVCTALYYREPVGGETQYEKVELTYTGMVYGENKIAWVDAAVAQSIPVDITLQFESASESYTFMDNLTYTPFASGNLSNGVGKVEWTSNIANAAKNGFMIYLTADCTALYYLKKK